MPFILLVAFGVLFGIGFGFFVQRSGLCFAHGMGEVYMGRGKRILRLFLIIFIITSLGFMLSGFVSPSLGLKPIGELRGYGFYNLLSGIVFGAGIALCGGCILGTLRQLGEGNLMFLVVLVSFIPGLALVVFGLNPLLEGGYDTQKVVLPQLLGVAAPYVATTLAAAAAICLLVMRNRKRRVR